MVIQEGDKFAMIALRAAVCPGLPSKEFPSGLWVSFVPPIALDAQWKEWLGSIRVKQIEGCNLFLLVKAASNQPGVLDAENKELQNRVWRYYLGLLLADRFATNAPPVLVTGAYQSGDLTIRQLSNLDHLVHEAADPRHRLDSARIEQGVRLGACMLDRPTHGMWRFNRILSLYVRARAVSEIVDRVHQYTRCLEGLTVPPVKGGTGKNFAARVRLFVGPNHGDLFEEVYKIRGKIEHLREHEFLETFDRQNRIDLMRKAGIVEYVARSCLVRIVESAALGSHFSSTSSLEDFWKRSEDDRAALWGKPIDPMEGNIGLVESRFTDAELGESA